MKVPENQEIVLLVNRCKAGDRMGFQQLYQLYCRAMYNTCLRILNNVAEAEDVLQESFTEAFKNIASFEQRSSFGSWLKQICINRSINELKKRKLSFVDATTSNLLEIPGEISPEDPEDVNIKLEAIKTNLLQLPDGYRTVLSLYLLEGYDHEEIAGILQVAESTVRTQYIRAKQKLINLLKNEYEQAGKIY